MARKLLVRFWQDAQISLKTLQTTISTGDSAICWQAGHPLKEASANLGLIGIPVIATQPERNPLAVTTTAALHVLEGCL